MKQSYKLLITIFLLVFLIGAGTAHANQSVLTDADAIPDIIIPTEIAFLVQSDIDRIHAFNWPLDALVTVNIDDPATEEADFTVSAVVPDEGLEVTFLDFDLGEEFDILPGHVITLSDGVTTKTHIVTDLAISSIEFGADLVNGVAEPESGLEVWVCWTDGCTANRLEAADIEGNWISDFSDSSQATFDLVQGIEVGAVQWDEDGNGTLDKFGVPFPVLLAPANNAAVEVSAPEFQWEETHGATGYEFSIVKVSSGEAASKWFEVGDGVTCAEGICSFLPDFQIPNGEYSWTIQPWVEDYGSVYADFALSVSAPEVEGSQDLPSKLSFNQAMFGAHGPGLHITPLIAGQHIDAGITSIWNSTDKIQIQVETTGDWLISEIQIYVGADPVPTKEDNPVPGKFPYKQELMHPRHIFMEVVDFESMDFRWGIPWEDERTQNIAVHVDLVQLNFLGDVIVEEGAWAYGPNEYAGDEWGYWLTYEMGHPKRGHFIDSPVGGVTVASPTFNGKTDASGGFDFFPGEFVDLSIGSVYLGNAQAAHKISPLDIYEEADISDPRVINMARLLQSLDADADPQPGIYITPEVEACLDLAVQGLSLTGVDFSNNAQVENVISGTISQCEGIVTLSAVSAEDAVLNLDRSLNANMHRKQVSRTPDLTSSKAKINIMGVWFPAKRANEEATVVEYYDENGALIRTAGEAKPIIITYTDGIPENGVEDVFAAVSRDDGGTFKVMNLSRAADRTSFTLENGQEYFGQVKKPVFQVKGNKILVAWTSKFCRGGRPAYAIDPEDDYIYDDPYYVEDIWGVSGPQRSVNYTELGHPEKGEVPFSCVWIARGTVVSEKEIAMGGFWADKSIGDIVWFKPERLTSGRRDANQVFVAGADGAGFALAWQEDPEGLQPGSAYGPGDGWGGATTSHKTDIWYSYISWGDFLKVDENFVSGGDPAHELDVTGRPKALVPLSLPVRITDNDAVNTDNLLVELDENGNPVEDANGNWIEMPNAEALAEESNGTHKYGYAVEGVCADFYEFINNAGALKKVCITEDGRLLNGDTGASRPNLFLQTYTKSDGTKSAWAIFAYEETKGVGLGQPDHNPEEGPYGDEFEIDEGKNAIYHSFDFQNPDVVSAGNIINLPERDVDGNLVYLVDEEGELLLDWQGNAQLAYENARRPRFIMQSKKAAGDSGTVMLVVYRQGAEGKGRPADVMLRRVVASGPGNPYAYDNFVEGAFNMSSVTPTLVVVDGEQQAEDPYGANKVVKWQQSPGNLHDESWFNPYEDARAQRGIIRGDFIVIGFTYTPNWAAARNGNDKYDFFIRRSFDGGQTWTTDPVADPLHAELEHCNTWTDPNTKVKTQECHTYGPGEFEPMRNLSQLPNNHSTVIEPRIVGPPGTIKDPVTGSWTGNPEDKQNRNVFYVSFGTSTNPKKDPLTGHQDSPHPLDLYFSFTMNQGQSFEEVSWVVNPDSDGNYAGETVTRWFWLAKGEPHQGEAQGRMTPDGSRFYATWLSEGSEGKDIWFRRIMPSQFQANQGQ
jgi:hypothetical protein